MGLTKEKYLFIQRNVEYFNELIMMELGNQIVKRDLKRYTKTKAKTGKEFWWQHKCYHFSIDVNGKDGTMNIDLTLPIPYYDNFFDIVTNINVSNYIKKYRKCYDNIYRFCKFGGIIIHCLPMKDSKWTKSHSADKKFYEEMAKKYSLTLLDCEEIKDKDLIMAAFKK